MMAEKAQTNASKKRCGNKVADWQRVEIARHSQAVAPAIILKSARLSGPHAKDCQTDYAAGLEWGIMLRRWRIERRIDRLLASVFLPHWDTVAIALIEEGLLPMSEVSAAMLTSLQRIGIII